MKKAWLVSSLLTVGLTGYAYYQKQKEYDGFSFRLLKQQMNNSGYRTIKTDDKGVFLLEKNNKYALFIYDNENVRKETLFNLLNRYEHMVDGQFFLLSESTNLLFGQTKPLFFRWNSLHTEREKPKVVHFSTLHDFKTLEEISWETNHLNTRL